jgi:hypothetical protein
MKAVVLTNHGRRDRAPADLSGAVAPAHHPAPGVLLSAAQVQDRRHGGHARSRRRQGSRHRIALAPQWRRRKQGFEVLVGGGLGRTPFIAKSIRPFLHKRDILSHVGAILRVYNQFPRRDNLYKSRIKILVHDLGAEAFAREVETEWQYIKDGPLALDPAVIAEIAAHFRYPDYARPRRDSQPLRFARPGTRAIEAVALPLGRHAVARECREDALARVRTCLSSGGFRRRIDLRTIVRIGNRLRRWPRGCVFRRAPPFPQRSPPWLLTAAACGGLRSTPDCRPRRALLHLSYSYASPCGPALLVTQDPFRTSINSRWSGGPRNSMPTACKPSFAAAPCVARHWSVDTASHNTVALRIGEKASFMR